MARTAGFAPAKAAQKSLTESMARHLWPSNIHVALVIVDGVVDLPRTRAMPMMKDGRLLRLDGPSIRTKHLPGDEIAGDDLDDSNDRRVSGTDAARGPPRLCLRLSAHRRGLHAG
jgi:NAD(P)-dependent dehydrogenase (short-subunit alcohol dehydrogenase family)